MDTRMPSGFALDAGARPARMTADLSERVFRPARDALALDLALGPNAIGSGVKTHCS